ncbi:hypothetical protein F5Y09DRAFT_341342 [Xylaria sp. FL1042]|nr:hypothetical protein F5Y09DRAFT_341342 [Xylaria sp. FL1042]
MGMTFNSEKKFTSETSSVATKESFDMENTVAARFSFSEDVAGQSPLRQHPNGCLCAACNQARRAEKQKQKKTTDDHKRPTPLFNVTKGWLAKNTRPCPALGCGAPTQKVAGGSSSKEVRCQQCGHAFCWTCLAPASSGRHDKTCGVKRAKSGLRRLVSDFMSGYALPPNLWRDFNGMFLDIAQTSLHPFITWDVEHITESGWEHQLIALQRMDISGGFNFGSHRPPNRAQVVDW